jgi:hypothetical protein
MNCSSLFLQGKPEKRNPLRQAGLSAGSRSYQSKTGSTAQRGALAITFVFGPDRENGIHGGLIPYA